MLPSGGRGGAFGFFGYAGGITSYLPDKAPCLRLDTRKQNTAVVLEELSSLLGPDVGPPNCAAF